MRRALGFLESLLGVVALVILAGVLVLISRTRSGGPVALQQATPVPVAPTPGPRVMDFRLSDAPDGPAVANFPSGTSLVYAIFEYAEMEDTSVQLRVFDGEGNILYERTNRYRGAGMDSIAVTSATEVFPDDVYVANIYLYMDSDLYPGPFLVASYEWAVSEGPLATAVPPTVPPPTPPAPLTVVPPTPAMPATPVAMETYISRTLIVANVGDGPGEIGIFLPPEGRPVVPTAIALDGEGNIYVFDAVNQRVVKYDSEGSFVSNIVPNPPMYGSAKDMCIGDNGAIYLLDGGGLFVRLYNQKGELVLEYPKPDWVEYFRSISLDNEGNLRAQVAELDLSVQDVRAILGDARKIVAVLGNSREVFSREQQLRASRPGILLGGDTWVGEYGRSDDGKEMLIFDERGVVILRLPILDIGAVTLDAWADKGGSLYFVMSMLRLSEIPDAMYKFDPRGNLLAHFPVPAPYYAYPERRFVINNAGNIYQLLPIRHDVQVIKWEKQ